MSLYAKLTLPAPTGPITASNLPGSTTAVTFCNVGCSTSWKMTRWKTYQKYTVEYQIFQLSVIQYLNIKFSCIKIWGFIKREQRLISAFSDFRCLYWSLIWYWSRTFPNYSQNLFIQANLLQTFTVISQLFLKVFNAAHFTLSHLACTLSITILHWFIGGLSSSRTRNSLSDNSSNCRNVCNHGNTESISHTWPHNLCTSYLFSQGVYMNWPILLLRKNNELLG